MSVGNLVVLLAVTAVYASVFSRLLGWSGAGARWLAFVLGALASGCLAGILEVVRGLLGVPWLVLFPAVALVPPLVLLRLLPSGGPRPPPWGAPTRPAGRVPRWVLAFSLVGVGAGLVSLGEALVAVNNGSWDAWMIWNQRVPALQRGLPQNLRFSRHPSYPPALPGFVAVVRGPSEVVTGGDFWGVPSAAVGVSIGVGVAVLLGTGLAWHGLTSAGLLAVALLVSGHGFVSASSSQTAEIPLVGMMLATLVWLSVAARLERGWLAAYVVAGGFAGLGQWVKVEGLLFLLACLPGLVLVERNNRHRAQALVAFLVPAGLLVLARVLTMKAVLGPVVPHAFPIDPRAWNLRRWEVVFSSMTRTAAGMSGGAMAVLLALWALGPRRRGAWALLVAPSLTWLGFALVLVLRQIRPDMPPVIEFILWSTQERLCFQAQAGWLLGVGLSLGHHLEAEAPPSSAASASSRRE